jgi:thioredoxin 1
MSLEILQNNVAAIDRAIKSGALVIIKFYLQSCGHCQAIQTQYEQMAAKVKQEWQDAYFFSIELSANPDVARDWKVDAVPTFWVFDHQKMIGEVTGANMSKLAKLIIQCGDD